MRRWHALLLSLLLAPAAPADDFGFGPVQLSEVNGQLTLDADIHYQLSEPATEALENGVPLTFVTHLEIREDGIWIWQADLVDYRLRSTLTYHALSSLYELHRLDSDQREQFATREAALRALGELRGIPLVDSSALVSGTRYTVRLDTYLDLEALPITLRPQAHLTPAWHLESDPWERPLTP